MKAPTERFTDRVADYTRYRPGYPKELIRFLEKQVMPPGPVADIGSGTGILTGQLMEAGYEVFAVEPNRAMAAEAERRFSGNHLFHSVSGSAEETGLPSESVRLITCAQAFHWFDRARARVEIQRILMPAGQVAIIWNERLDATSPFLKGYEEILRKFAPEYAKVDHRRITSEQIEEFFSPGAVECLTLSYPQPLTREQLIGRALSSSYVPNKGEPGYREIVAALEELFDGEQAHGQVIMEYETRVFLGKFESWGAAS
jgi:SAM-dependent methyltransferase